MSSTDFTAVVKLWKPFLVIKTLFRVEEQLNEHAYRSFAKVHNLLILYPYTPDGHVLLQDVQVKVRRILKRLDQERIEVATRFIGDDVPLLQQTDEAQVLR